MVALRYHHNHFSAASFLHQVALELLHSLRPYPCFLLAQMHALRPDTRSLSRRKLDFEEPKLIQAATAKPLKKRVRKIGSGASNEPIISEPGGSLLRDGKETQKEGPLTYRRRSFRQVLERDTVKSKCGLTSTKVLEGSLETLKIPVELSSNDSLSPRPPMKALASGLQVEVRAMSGADDDIAKSSSDLGIKIMQSLHGDVNSHTQDSEMADSTLSTAKCLDIVPLDVGPLLHRVDTAIVYEGPYPSFPRPAPEECNEVCHRLSLLHGPLEEYAKHKVAKISDEEVLLLEYHKEEDSKGAPGGSISTGLQSLGPRLRRTVLDSLVGTILSQNTTDKNSRRAFASLKASFPTWELVYEADPKAVEEAIRCGGLAEIKTSRILNILRTLNQERGKLCLEYVRKLSTDEVKLELSRFKGVGPKTIACVLMFHLQQNEFPVDTHVFRITKMLGWVPAKADREKAYLHLNNRIPDHLKFDLHCLLVTHGKRCPRCAKGGRTQRAADGPCPLINLSQDLLTSAQYDLLLEP